ncbi:hypothetical protein TrRE_jg259, partial [Triparma retinervis]
MKEKIRLEGKVDEESCPATTASLCSICLTVPSKYTCPRCFTLTCSLACVLVHKSHTSCTGRRDLVGFKPVSQMDDSTLRDDISVVEEGRRRVREVHKVGGDVDQRRGGGQGKNKKRKKGGRGGAPGIGEVMEFRGGKVLGMTGSEAARRNGSKVAARKREVGGGKEDGCTNKNDATGTAAAANSLDDVDIIWSICIRYLPPAPSDTGASPLASDWHHNVSEHTPVSSALAAWAGLERQADPPWKRKLRGEGAIGRLGGGGGGG